MVEPERNPLPVDECLPAILEGLENRGTLVLVAAPGAGKTTRVPPELLKAPWCRGKAIVLQPRRLAARSAAGFVARRFGEKVGETVGYRVRLESVVSNGTRIEYVTEGVFTRMIAADPELTGVSAVILDEFHERNLEGDLALSLLLESQDAFRPDLRLLVMSATLAGGEVAQFLGDAPLVESAGRSFPVEIHHMPRRDSETVSEAMARAARSTLAGHRGSILCFLPGQREIRETAARLSDDLPPDTDLHQLFGAMDMESQDAAIRPAPENRRKIVLATDIAETSLTIEGVSVVIDSGLRRIPRYEPDYGLSRLETVRASRAAIEQRAGRAGRTGPGLVVRLWPEAQTAGLPERERPEILDADLSDLALVLADWGVREPGDLRWMTPPPQPAWNEAVRELATLGALSPDGSITPLGRKLRKMPLAPRLGRMVVTAAASGQAETAAQLAMLLSERGPGGFSIDIGHRLERLGSDRSTRAKALCRTARSIAKAAIAGGTASAGREYGAGGLLSLAYPDRIAKSRGQAGQFLLANGRGAQIDEAEPLARSPFLVALQLQGRAAASRITAAAAIDETEIEVLHGDRIERARGLDFDEQAGQFRAFFRQRLGALTLSQAPVPLEPSDETGRAVCDLVRRRGTSILPWNKNGSRLRSRISFLNAHEAGNWPAVDEEHLAGSAEDWLLPFLGAPKGPGDIAPDVPEKALRYLIDLSGNRMEELDRLTPTHFITPAGSRIEIEYNADAAQLNVRVQELFGMSTHPAILEGKFPLTLQLLSPAMRPIQITTDIVGFWKGSWAEVRREMRGRYPKHSWPEDPLQASPMRGAKSAQRK